MICRDDSRSQAMRKRRKGRAGKGRRERGDRSDRVTGDERGAGVRIGATIRMCGTTFHSSQQQQRGLPTYSLSSPQAADHSPANVPLIIIYPFAGRHITCCCSIGGDHSHRFADRPAVPLNRPPVCGRVRLRYVSAGTM